MINNGVPSRSLPAVNALVVKAFPELIYFANAFSILVGYIDPFGELHKLTPSDYTYTILTRNLTVNNGLWTATQPGSYGIVFNYTVAPVPLPPLPLVISSIFYFYVATPLKQMSYNKLYTIFKQELPSSYNNDIDINSGNYLDNYATVNILNDTYKLIYNIISQQYPSNGYTTNWEYALNGTNRLFQIAKYPAEITALLYRIPYNTGINRHDLTLFIAKYCYYFLGYPVIVYIDSNSNITVYAAGDNPSWILGDAIDSILGSTTILGSENSNLFAYLLLLFVMRLFPVQVLWSLTFSNTNPDPSLLTDVGFTYFGDSRAIVALKYLGNSFFPFNIEGYTLT